ncbi:putative transcription factor protein [Rosellinia necatrix]|uniref:Putative transcription factor protein n=1 Tax=Rosellinia necatrix TaxID=77044 RepID=A0A1W2TVB0_ROSNE|nr:putative transcription factor protein [Rosellinia necatrix]
MAHYHDAADVDNDPRNPYASANKWRHQESSAFARAAVARNPQSADTSTSRDLSDFLNASRIEPARPATNGNGAGVSYQPIVIGEADGGVDEALVHDGKEIICGPLLNYRRMEGSAWYGSVLVVTRGGGETQSFQPTLRLGCVESAVDQSGFVLNGSSVNDAEVIRENGSGPIWSNHGTDVAAVCLYSDPRATFWTFPITCDMRATETKWAYSISDVRYKSATKPKTNYFFVPAIDESMRIMFYSCNGFSIGTDEDAWSGPALWKDVIRSHTRAPFHVMIGGGDQIYNDGIRVAGPLREWTEIGNPKKRRDYPFPEKLRRACDDYYLNNYLRWYSTEPFAAVNGRIPQLNIWDDHDIIDGFGSYVDDFMKCDVFRGIGGTAHKYYVLFQHHLAPPASTYTTDAPHTMEFGGPEDQAQLVNTYVRPREMVESCYIIGSKPGPYVAEHSMNMFAKLGARIAFMGIDARTERTRHQVNYPETYDLIFNRVQSELHDADLAGRPFRHLILLLGIPIAYPRLTWLENVFSSPIIAPIKFMNRRFGFGGGVFNHFDGSVDLLDDLDDHYTAKTHKKERNALVERLQGLCAEFSVRLTILGGDVHLAALGRFYSNPNLHIPAEKDHRYMVNVVSSAIVNKPPPAAIANLLASRNKIHHLNADTDETLMDLFDKDPGNTNKTRGSNHVTMPSRNYAILTENSPNNRSAPMNGYHEHGNGEEAMENAFDGKDGHSYLHAGEDGAGTQHRAAGSETHGKRDDGSLDCCIRVEINQRDKEGQTEPYGLTIPALDYEAGKFGTNAHHRLGLRHHRSRPGTGASTAPPSTRSAPEPCH